MYELPSPNFRGIFESLPDDAVPSLEIMNPEPLPRAIVEVDEER